MKRFIHKFLTRNYYFKKGKFYSHRDDRVTAESYLKKQLRELYSLTDKQLKWYVKSWWVKRNHDFKGFWKGDWTEVDFFGGIAIPLIRRMNATLVGQDMVSVQPLSMPTGLLFYLDHTIRRENERELNEN